jgi:hypothetical protein
MLDTGKRDRSIVPVEGAVKAEEVAISVAPAVAEPETLSMLSYLEGPDEKTSTIDRARLEGRLVNGNVIAVLWVQSCFGTVI